MHLHPQAFSIKTKFDGVVQNIAKNGLKGVLKGGSNEKMLLGRKNGNHKCDISMH